MDVFGKLVKTVLRAQKSVDETGEQLSFVLFIGEGHSRSHHECAIERHSTFHKGDYGK
jgi:hypothetical protein